MSSQLSPPGFAATGRPASSERTGTYGTAPTAYVTPLSRSFARTASTPARLFGWTRGGASTISLRWISPRYRSIDVRSYTLAADVGTVALTFRMSMIGRPTNVG